MTSLRRTERGMANVRLSKLEFAIMETLWTKGRVSIREMLEGVSGEEAALYNTVQTMVYRLEAKGAVTRIRMSGTSTCLRRRLRARRRSGR